MADNQNLPLELQKAMSDPRVKNSTSENLIANIAAAMGIDDLEAIDEEKVKEIRSIYFQAFTLKTDSWTLMPGARGINAYVQIIPFKPKSLPSNTSIVADVLIDKTDFEAECFERNITGMAVRGKSIVFYANTAIPIDITIGLKCVDVNTGDVVAVPDECFKKA